MSMWLWDRVDPSHPKPFFDFIGTANWMRALAMVCDAEAPDSAALATLYRTENRRGPVNEAADTNAYLGLLKSLHHVAALSEFSREGAGDSYATIRAAIVSWYYAIYEAVKAMLAAASGTQPEKHRTVQRSWHTEILQAHRAWGPFGIKLDSLIPGEIDAALDAEFGARGKEILKPPSTLDEARAVLRSYASGTVAFERDRAAERVRGSSAFRKAGYTNFRTKAARELRDAEFRRGYVNFLVQAFRFRGKANYRDSFYLSCGPSFSDHVVVLTRDLRVVAATFVRMAGHFVRLRAQRETWARFIADLERNFHPRLPQGALP